jgi:maltose alpha-D-glucosyltransferase / alpha-amylase
MAQQENLDLSPARLLEALPAVLPGYLQRQRWFGGKARAIRAVAVTNAVPVPLPGGGAAFVVFADVVYQDGRGEMYALPLIPASLCSPEDAIDERTAAWELRIPVGGDSPDLVLREGLASNAFRTALLELIAGEATLRGVTGAIEASAGHILPEFTSDGDRLHPSALLNVEQSNSSVVYGRRLILKFFRRLEEGINPDLEIGAFLTERTEFRSVPPVAGALVYRREDGKKMTLGILQQFVENRGDAWRHALEAVAGYYARVAALPEAARAGRRRAGNVLALIDEPADPRADELLGDYLVWARLLGRRTAELHLALASATSEPEFLPEEFTAEFRQGLWESLDGLAREVFALLQGKKDDLAGEVAEEAGQALALESAVHNRFGRVRRRNFTAMRTRIHGDYHLGQALFTGSDFVMIDFEGEPARPLSQRRMKRSPLEDVAGMLRSFHYAAYGPLLAPVSPQPFTGPTLAQGRAWASLWQHAVSAAFLKKYLETSGTASYLPRSKEELEVLLEVFLLGKAVYELGYELNNRPGWVRIPVEAILQQFGKVR